MQKSDTSLWENTENSICLRMETGTPFAPSSTDGNIVLMEMSDDDEVLHDLSLSCFNEKGDMLPRDSFTNLSNDLINLYYFQHKIFSILDLV